MSLVVSLPVFSQTGYVGKLQIKAAGEGEIIIRQDDRITSLVNSDSSFPEAAAKTGAARHASGRPAGEPKTQDVGAPGEAAETAESAAVHVRHVKGYRIQVYAGNNSRKSRIEAAQAGQRVRGLFPELPVYTHFYPPRWVCRVGDFRTAEEAQACLAQIRESKLFPAATLIKTTVQTAY